MTREIISDQWMSLKDQRGPDGLLTPLALALAAIEDNGCDCETDEEEGCLACLCEAALLDLWERGRGNGTAAMVARLTEGAVAECMGDPRIAALLERSMIPATFLAWLDDEIEAARQPGPRGHLDGEELRREAARTALERVKVRLTFPPPREMTPEDMDRNARQSEEAASRLHEIQTAPMDAPEKGRVR